MTLAICLKCGARKVGVFTRCLKCGFTPESPEDQARSIALSDHNMRPEELAAVAEAIGAGRPPKFDDGAISRIAQTIRENPDLMKVPIGCRMAIWAPIVIMLALLAILAGLVLYVIYLMLSR